MVFSARYKNGQSSVGTGTPIAGIEMRTNLPYEAGGVSRRPRGQNDGLNARGINDGLAAGGFRDHVAKFALRPLLGRAKRVRQQAAFVEQRPIGGAHALNRIDVTVRPEIARY